MPCATLAQEQWFGRERRRVMRWFDHERPVLRGQPADTTLRALQRCGEAPFVRGPMAQLLDEVAVDLRQRTGLVWAPFALDHTVGADVLVVALAGAMPVLCGGARRRGSASVA
ncbi:MAG: hypothetical protein H6835_01895 [Planctomycetes bacterium]|nr:hypothetical protein [Planctomycetota bacterium]